MIFFVGVHQVSDAHQVDHACISLERLRGRKSAFRPARKGVLFDSGAFSLINRDGCYLESPEDFAARAATWVRRTPGTIAVVSQDYMCEPAVLAKTGLTVAEHQRLTIERYDAILAAWHTLFGKPVECGPNAPLIMPVLQGWTVADYLSHLTQYGDRLTPGMRVGVGSVCKRQGSVVTIEAILTAIATERPDLRLHGFGVKLTALQSHLVRDLLDTADSMAWAFAARQVAHRRIRALQKELGRKVLPSEARSILNGRGLCLPDANNIREAIAFTDQILTPPKGDHQYRLFAA